MSVARTSDISQTGGFRRKIVAVFLLAFIWSGQAQAKSIEYVVFSMSGTRSGLNLGQILREGDRVDLSVGAKVQLLSKNGKVVSLGGPLSAIITDDGKNSRTAKNGATALSQISQYLFAGRRYFNAIGGTRIAGRGTDIQAVVVGHKDLNPWVPEISAPGPYCLRGADPRLGRGKLRGRVDLVIDRNEPGEHVIVWKPNVKVLPLSRLAAADLSHHSLHYGKQDSNAVIYLQKKQSISLAEQVAWMARMGCRDQALRLLAHSAAVQR